MSHGVPLPASPGDAVRRRWCEVLDVASAAEDDDFFHSGGTSQLAVRLSAALSEDLGRRVPVAAVFATRTLAAFTARVAAPEPAPDSPTAPPVAQTR